MLGQGCGAPVKHECASIMVFQIQYKPNSIADVQMPPSLIQHGVSQIQNQIPPLIQHEVCQIHTSAPNPMRNSEGWLFPWEAKAQYAMGYLKIKRCSMQIQRCAMQFLDG